VQFVKGNAVADRWHTVQSGATEFGETPVTAWHAEQSASKLVGSAEVWGAPGKGTGWITPPGPPEWHSVLLKHPGGVPSAAGVAGWFAGLFGDPGKWHGAQTGAFSAFAFMWVYVGPSQGRAGCGAFAPWQGKHDF
jgi:hypothetical protein